MTRALEGLTVLALEQATTLPFLTYRLACDGARVIRVENRARPDPNRFVGRDLLGEPDMGRVARLVTDWADKHAV